MPPGLEGYYEVSNMGSIRSIDRAVIDKNGVTMNFKGKMISLTPEGGGYLKFMGRKGADKKIKCNKVHKLVAKAFVPNPHNKPIINHINSIKTDNRAENLEWCTPKENRDHAVASGRLHYEGESCTKSKLKEKDVSEIISLEGKIHPKKLAKKYNVSPHTIRGIYKGRVWQHFTGRNNTTKKRK